MLNTIKNIIRDEEGATMVEYALIVAVVAIVALVGYRALGTAVNDRTTAVADDVKP